MSDDLAVTGTAEEAPPAGGGQRPQSTPTGWWARRWADVLASVALAAAVAVVQLIYLKPPWIYDPADYYLSAQQWPDVFIHHRPLRVGLVVPVRVLQELFGLSEASWYGVPLLAAIGLSLATFAIGRMLFGSTVGFAAGLLVVLNPYVLTWSSQIFPDIPSAALFTAGVAVTLHVARQCRGGVPLRPRDHVMLLCAGLLFGWAYLVREFIVVLFPVALLVLALHRTRWTAVLSLTGAAAAVFAGELALNGILYGHPLIRVDEILHKSVPVTGELREAAIAARRAERGSTVDRLLLLPRLLRRHEIGVPMLVLIGLGGVGAAIDRHRRSLPLVAWAVTVWGLLIGLSFVETASGGAVIHPNLMRYWYPIFPPVLIAGLGAVGLLVARVRRLPAWASATAVVLVALGLASGGIRGAEAQGSVRSGDDEFREFRTHLATTDPAAAAVWTDHRTGRMLPIYLRSPFGGRVWSGEVQWFNNNHDFRAEGAVTGGLVLLEDQFYEPRHSNARGAVPDWLIAIPDTWDLRWMSDNSEIALWDTTGGDDVLVRTTDPGPDWSWTVLPRRGSTYAEATPLSGTGTSRLRIGPGEAVVVVDGGAPSLKTGEGGVPVSAGSYVAFDLELAATGNGNVSMRCMFFEGARHRDTNVVTLWGVPAPLGITGGSCRAPTDGTFRLGLVVRGPAQVELGGMSVWVDEDGEDGSPGGGS